MLRPARSHSDGAGRGVPVRGREGAGVRGALQQGGAGRDGSPPRVSDTSHAAQEEEATAELAYTAPYIRIGWNGRQSEGDIVDTQLDGVSGKYYVGCKVFFFKGRHTWRFYDSIF